MSHKKWHLDVKYESTLFSRNWTTASSSLLLKLFTHLDSTNEPVLSMLPPGVSPAGAAAAAAIYFLPGMNPPPKPHCRIALFPGLHFVRQLKTISFEPVNLWKASQTARAAQRGYHGIEGPFDRLRLKHKDIEPIHFHWLFRCNRNWTRMWQKESNEILPRAHFGRNDPYFPTIDFIETENLDLYSNKFEPYDLLIYCPYFHSRTTEQTDQDLNNLVAKVANFAADRKLIIARSPFDYWSRRLEQKFKLKGIALSSEDVKSNDSDDLNSGVKFIIVNQFLDMTESRILYDSIREASKGSDLNRANINEMKFLLRRLLVSLDPRPREGEETLEDMVARMESLAEAIGIPNDEKAREIIQVLKNRISDSTAPTKLEKIAELISSDKYEIWVTKDLDRQTLSDLRQTKSLNYTIRLADRWMAPGSREQDRKVILTRIDREGDLDLTAYLKGNDAIIMSAWEATVRGVSIMASWERSERWREQARKCEIAQDKKGIRYADPVLDLANYLDSEVDNHKPKMSPDIPSSEDVDPTTWWDEHDSGSILATDLERDELLAKTGGKTVLCRELRFEGNYGMFVREDDEMQVIDENDSDGDISPVPVPDLEPDMIVILFKDSERSSIFDILMDQLERSSEHQQDARVVRDWKDKLKEHTIKNGIRVSALATELEKRGRSFDYITIRSWIFGSTMAPMKQPHLQLLIDAIGLPNMNAFEIFKSVKRLRTIARTLGRALNDVIVQKDLDKLDGNIRSALIEAGIDLEELSGAIETRRLAEMLPHAIEIETKNIRKLYRTNDTVD